MSEVSLATEIIYYDNCWQLTNFGLLNWHIFETKDFHWEESDKKTFLASNTNCEHNFQEDS